jgi:hypothetical protein
MICDHLTTCAFIDKTSRIEPVTAKIIRLTYCEKNKYMCAIYKVSQYLHIMEIPENLWPSEDMKSLEMPDTNIPKE